MAQRVTRRTVGLQDDSMDPNRINTFQPNLWHKAVILVEIGVTSLRREFFDEQYNDEQLRINLDCLDEVRDQASQRMTKYQKKMVKYNNQRVKLKMFNIGDLVL